MNQVERYRRMKNWSQRRLAREMNYSQPAIHKIEREYVEPLDRTKDLLAQVLGVSVKELFPEEHVEVVSVA